MLFLGKRSGFGVEHALAPFVRQADIMQAPVAQTARDDPRSLSVNAHCHVARHLLRHQPHLAVGPARRPGPSRGDRVDRPVRSPPIGGSADLRSRLIDAYAKGSTLHDAMSVAEAPGGLAAGDAPPGGPTSSGAPMIWRRRCTPWARRSRSALPTAPGSPTRSPRCRLSAPRWTPSGPRAAPAWASRRDPQPPGLLRVLPPRSGLPPSNYHGPRQQAHAWRGRERPLSRRDSASSRARR